MATRQTKQARNYWGEETEEIVDRLGDSSADVEQSSKKVTIVARMPGIEDRYLIDVELYYDGNCNVSVQDTGTTVCAWQWNVNLKNPTVDGIMEIVGQHSARLSAQL